MSRFTFPWAAGAASADARRGGEARSIGALVGSRNDRPSRRTGQPVRRNSIDVGDPRERLFWRPVKKTFMRQHLRAAEEFDRATRQPGQRNGALGHVGLEVVRFLFRKVCWRDGRLDPAVLTICRAIGRSKDAVVRALRSLKEYGFLEWIRRSEPIEGAVGPGPRVRQASNAYRLLIPKALMRAFRAPPPPADDAHRRAEAAAEARRCEAQLSDAEWVGTFVTDPGLRSALLALERSLADQPA